MNKKLKTALVSLFTLLTLTSCSNKNIEKPLDNYPEATELYTENDQLLLVLCYNNEGKLMDYKLINESVAPSNIEGYVIIKIDPFQEYQYCVNIYKIENNERVFVGNEILNILPFKNDNMEFELIDVLINGSSVFEQILYKTKE